MQKSQPHKLFLLNMTRKRRRNQLKTWSPRNTTTSSTLSANKRWTHIPESLKWNHKLKEDFSPKVYKVYQLSQPEHKALDTFLDNNLRKGYIRPPIASPFFFVAKKDRKLRLCQDYQYLNSRIVKNAYPLPLIRSLLEQLNGTKYFTKLDICWGYNNIRIKEGHQWKAAFITERGLFEPTVMFFSLYNSPAIF